MILKICPVAFQPGLIHHFKYVTCLILKCYAKMGYVPFEFLSCSTGYPEYFLSDSKFSRQLRTEIGENVFTKLGPPKDIDRQYHDQIFFICVADRYALMFKYGSNRRPGFVETDQKFSKLLKGKGINL